jgi:hypothetical protein
MLYEMIQTRFSGFTGYYLLLDQLYTLDIRLLSLSATARSLGKRFFKCHDPGGIQYLYGCKGTSMNYITIFSDCKCLTKAMYGYR